MVATEIIKVYLHVRCEGITIYSTMYFQERFRFDLETDIMKVKANNNGCNR